ncbi:hypothetical protein AB833_10465 [Chromatiales bacterium (ex Bugula neritina AB1)]|nr:hypothetical protein AB833_10465 [Chromatiales bacterium (ex Bugula neritina AB1)]
MSDETQLNRQAILEGQITQLAESKSSTIRLMPDDVRARAIAETLSQAPSLDEVWIYAYGSLLWNPAIHVADTIKCTVDGYHRSFCFWTVLGRGCEENPGLMMGLEPGGSSNGLAYRIDAQVLDTEMDILFRREMMSYVYQPTWVEARLAEQPDKSIKVLAFVVDPEHERFCGGLDEATLIRHIATAAGPFGRNCDYLFQLMENLNELGFTDEAMAELEMKVKQYQEAQANS